jgi:GH18 family chitinase
MNRGNRDDYKKIPNSEREWEIEAYVKLLEVLRTALGPNRLLTIAVPGAEVDLMAFTHATVPRIVKVVDFINVMTYDLLNRRGTTVQHHSGVQASRDSIQRYVNRGASPSMLNLGLGYYVKWFLTEPGCDADHPVGCPTQLMEDPETGDDLGRCGGFSWHDETPHDVALSFARAQTDGVYDEDGSYGYWDEAELRWWSFDTPRVVEQKMDDLVGGMGLGGAFAWGLGEDAPAFAHLKATIDGLERLRAGDGSRDEL